jgi:hypothetical protein
MQKPAQLHDEAPNKHSAQERYVAPRTCATYLFRSCLYNLPQ